MAILPISSVDFNTRSNVSFARKNDSEGAPADRGMTAPLGKTVPVIVLMAMNPSLLNSAATKAFIPEEAPDYHVTSLVADTQQEADEATYVIGADDLESMHNIKKAPYGWGYFNHTPINEVHRGHNGAGDFDMVFAHDASLYGDDVVSEVYILKGERKNTVYSAYHPARVLYVLRHDTGEGNGSWGVITGEDLIKEDGQTKFGVLEKETRIDDDTANKLIDLIKNKSNWQNRTGLLIKATKSPQFVPPKRYDP